MLSSFQESSKTAKYLNGNFFERKYLLKKIYLLPFSSALRLRIRLYLYLGNYRHFYKEGALPLQAAKPYLEGKRLPRFTDKI